MIHQPYRQIHLDFHTSADCQNVGQDFDPQRFAQVLKEAGVNSINIFAKCHHGYSYYPTLVGTPHPGLKFDLLGAQLEALHQAGIRAPIYISVKWDDLAAMQNPGWMIINKDNTARMRPPLDNGWGWCALDVASGYGDYVYRQVEEICKSYPIDGFFFDICFPMPNYSPWSQRIMRSAGIHLERDAEVLEYAYKQDLRFFERISSLIHRYAPQAIVFYNGTVLPNMGGMLPYQTHFEIESLPTSDDTWGYMHYPIAARHARTYGIDFTGMTGRFHKSWADFGGLKTHDQLEYEVGTILAAGGRICIGDQMRPEGDLDPAVYRLVGRAYRQVEALEPWLEGAKPAAEIAILALGDEVDAAPGVASYSEEVEGAAQLFLESGIQFDILTPDQAFETYPALLLPHNGRLNADLIRRLDQYLKEGGKLVLSGNAAWDEAKKAYSLKELPLLSCCPAPTTPSYLRLEAAMLGDSELAADYDYAFYDQAYQVEAAPGAACFGQLKQAYFTRTWEHFCSHKHAPVGGELGAPLVVRTENVLYFGAPVFGAYRKHDYWVYRALAAQALRQFIRPLLIPQGPGWVEFALHTQSETQRKVVHVVAYHPRRSLQRIQHVDNSWPVSGLGLRLRLDGFKPQRVYLAPNRLPLDFVVADGYLAVDLPPIRNHAVVVVE